MNFKLNLFLLIKPRSKRQQINPDTGLSKSLSFSFIQLPSLNSNLTAEFLVRSSSQTNNTKVKFILIF